MSHPFSTSARALLQIIWKTTERVAKYDEMIEKSIENNLKLKDRVGTVEVAYVCSSLRIQFNDLAYSTSS